MLCAGDMREAPQLPTDLQLQMDTSRTSSAGLMAGEATDEDDRAALTVGEVLEATDRPRPRRCFDLAAAGEAGQAHAGGVVVEQQRGADRRRVAGRERRAYRAEAGRAFEQAGSEVVGGARERVDSRDRVEASQRPAKEPSHGRQIAALERGDQQPLALWAGREGREGVDVGGRRAEADGGHADGVGRRCRDVALEVLDHPHPGR